MSMNMNDEVICGFLVTAEQKKVKAVYLDLMKELDRLCRRAGITYFLVFGSLIGAARHQGFIPWDDDVDIAVPRKDFDRLLGMTCEQFGAQWPYFLQNPVTDPNNVDTLIRFRRDDTTAIHRWDYEDILSIPEGAPYHMGVSLSLFPLDNVPRGEKNYRRQVWLEGFMFNIYKRAYAPWSEKPLRRFISSVPRWLLGRKRFMQFCDWPYRILKTNRSGKVQIFGESYPENTVFLAEDFAETVLVPFEDLEMPIPAGYDRILTASYGDWRQFPPEDKRVLPHAGVLDTDTPYEETIRRLRAGELAWPEEWTRPAETEAKED